MKKIYDAIFCTDNKPTSSTDELAIKLKEGFKVVMSNRVEATDMTYAGWRYILEKSINEQ